MYRSVTAGPDIVPSRAGRAGRRISRAAAIAAIVLAPAGAAAQTLGQVFVEVIDTASGAPVTDLPADAFRVTEDGRPGGVVSAVVEAAPMKIALLVDNGARISDTRAIADLRNGITAFLDDLAPQHAVGLFTISRQTRRRVDFTVDRVELGNGVGQIFADDGGSVRVFDGIRDTWRRRFGDDEPFPVFVLVVSDGAEGSGSVTPGEFAELGEQLMRNDVIIHAVLLTTAGGSSVTSMAMNLTQNTGGVLESINVPNALPRTLAGLAARLNDHYDRVSSWYRVVYERPDPPGASISLSLTAPAGVSFDLALDRRVPDGPAPGR